MRTGSFSRMTHDFGQALAVVKPMYNDPGSATPPELVNMGNQLTEAQRAALHQDILDLFNLYRGERDL